jgi:hypothetical protein
VCLGFLNCCQRLEVSCRLFNNNRLGFGLDVAKDSLVLSTRFELTVVYLSFASINFRGFSAFFL